MNGFGRKGGVWGGAALLAAALFFFSGNALADERLEAPSTVSETQEAGGAVEVSNSEEAADENLEQGDESLNQPDAANEQPLSDDGANAPAPVVDDQAISSVSVSAHVQDYGWLPSVKGGDVAGTTGKGKRLEAFYLNIGDALPSDSLSVRAYVAGSWLDAVGNNELVGTVGKGKAIEAVSISLSDELSASYSIWYRVHSADVGWLGWAHDGENAGTICYGHNAEAIQILVLLKGDSAPGSTDNAFKDHGDDPAAVLLQAHVANLGWMSQVGDGVIAGTTGKGLRLEALRASVDWFGRNSGIELRAHVSNFGWQEWASGQCGTTGRAAAIEALQIRLTGDAAESYDVWYRVHSADYGWLGWTSNGSPAGTTGLSKQVEAVQVKLVPKGSSAPGDTARSIIGDYDSLAMSGKRIGGISLSTPKKRDVVLGSTNNGNALRQISASLVSAVESGSIEYRTLTQFMGWQDWSKDGQVVGSDSDKQIKAVQMRLTGEIAEKYDLWYRVYDTSGGWMGWASNGDSAGQAYGSSGVRAIEVALVEKGASSPGGTGNAYAEGSAGLVVQAHVADAGWLSPVASGDVAGQTGRSRSMQALRVGLDGIDGTISVQAHVAGIGWQDAVTNGATVGTTGQNRAIEAVRISLSGVAEDEYDIYYSIHSADYGWLGWAKNGNTAGTTGLGKRAEAIKVMLVKKGESAPSSNSPACISVPELSLSADPAGLGWQAAVGNGSIAGTTGRGISLQALKASVNSDMSGGISYSAHVSNAGWQSTVSDGAIAGLEGKQKIEAVKFSLTGSLSTYFDIWYRVHIADYGWLGWTKNGSAAGTTKLSLGVQAVQVKIVAKGSSAPGSTSNSYFEQYRYIGHQNPSGYPQLSCFNVVLPSYCQAPFNYVSPSKLSYNATRQQAVDAFIARAYEYIGTQFKEPWSTAPGNAVDCSGFVLQCCYAVGMDLGWYNPWNHYYIPSQTYNSMRWYENNTFMPISTSSIQRGDLVYYQGHVAIYLGNNQIIDSRIDDYGNGVRVRPLYHRDSHGNWTHLIGAARPIV